MSKPPEHDQRTSLHPPHTYFGPAHRRRVSVAFGVGLAAATFRFLFELQFPPGHHSDFGQIWFGAVALLQGENPYSLIGPGRTFEWDWPLYYPAPALILGVPFTILPEQLASAAFVGIGAFLLAYLLTARSWHRLPLFGSVAFITAASAAQWSPFMTAALIAPGWGWLTVAKPSYALPWLLTVTTYRQLAVSVAGGIVLIALSFALSPSWPLEWVAAARTATHMTVPIAQSGGVLLLLILLRWRRPEARLFLALACMPQTFYWYETLPLLLVPETLRQSLYLVLIASGGYLMEDGLLRLGFEVSSSDMGGILIATTYLPCLIVILRRPNSGREFLLYAWYQRLGWRSPPT